MSTVADVAKRPAKVRTRSGRLEIAAQLWETGGLRFHRFVVAARRRVERLGRVAKRWEAVR